MKRIYNILLTMLLSVIMLGCNSHRVIPDKILANIFHDALLVNAYIQQNPQYKKDSLNIYEPIFAKYGYTAEDMHHTINKIAGRKSSSLGNVTDYMSKLLEEQSEALHIQVNKQDTIESVAARRYNTIIYHDTAIVAKTEADTALVQISIRHAKRGIYRITGSYTIDREDKGIGRRYAVSWKCGDSLIRDAANNYIIKGRKGSISTEVTLTESDSMADNLVIDFTRFNMKKHRLKKTPITIHELKVEYNLGREESLERIFNEQSNLRIFADTMIKIMVQPKPTIEADSTTITNTAEQPIAADSVQTQTQE